MSYTGRFDDIISFMAEEKTIDLNRKLNINEVTEYILAIPKFAEKIGTDSLRVLMEKLGNPERKYLTLHVAGTNGKGSTTEMLSLMLTEAGFKTGNFTSPHLVKINERIRLGGSMISDADFIRCFRIVLKTVTENQLKHPSFFEFIFAMAAVYFAEMKANAVVFETGMGGRLDATNIICPEVSVITSIGMDHMQYLGDTVEKIAFEKAGIIKPGVPVVHNMCAGAGANSVGANPVGTNSEGTDSEGVKCAEHDLIDPANRFADMKKRAAQVIIDKAAEEASELTLVDHVDQRILSWIENGEITNDAFKVSYQLENASTAVCAFEIFCRSRKLTGDTEKIMKRALQSFKMPARMEKIRKNVIIDGAHNQDAIPQFIRAAEQMIADYKPKKVKLLFAVSSDKDYTSMIEMLCQAKLFDTVFLTTFTSDRRTEVEVIKRVFDRFSGEGGRPMIRCIPVLRECLNEAFSELHDDEMIFAAGSLYLAGEIEAMVRHEQ